jgi:hypothetical protein
MYFIILEGMWGFYNKRNILISNKIYSLMINKEITKSYNFGNKKLVDQYFLRDHVFPLVKNDAIIHDSYNCERLGGNPFPSRRIGLCHIGQKIFDSDCKTANDTNLFFTHRSPICPIECRPKEYLDWETC